MIYTKGCWNKKKKLQKLLDVGNDKMDGELDVINIMNDLRNLKIMLTFSIMTRQVREKIQYTGKNIIDLDTSSSDDCAAKDIESKRPCKKEIGLKEIFEGWKTVVQESKNREMTPPIEYSFQDNSVDGVNLPQSGFKKSATIGLADVPTFRKEIQVVSDNRLEEEPSMIFNEIGSH